MLLRHVDGVISPIGVSREGQMEMETVFASIYSKVLSEYPT